VRLSSENFFGKVQRDSQANLETWAIQSELSNMKKGGELQPLMRCALCFFKQARFTRLGGKGRHSAQKNTTQNEVFHLKLTFVSPGLYFIFCRAFKA